MKKLHFFTGPAGSGHKEALYRAAVEAMRKGDEVIFIVPEQATFLAEQRLTQMAGGLIGLQVLSFKRLSERVLEETGRRRPNLNEQGLAMVTRRVAGKKAEELKIYSRAVKQNGFCTELSGLFGELKRAMITPEELLEKAPAIQGSSLTREKLMDVAVLYKETEDWIAQRYMTEDDGVNAAIRLIPRSFVAGTVLFIDFDGLASGTRQFESLFSALLSAAREMTCTVTADPNETEETLFAPAEQMKGRLSELAASMGVTVTERRFSGEPPRPAALRYVSDTLFRSPGKDFEGYLAARGLPKPEVPAIEIHAYSNCAQEAEGVADLILSYAKKGIRYRDMAVLASDGDLYEKLLRRSFALRNIPMFADQKRGFATFSAVDTLVAALRCAAGSFRTGDMLRLAKSGFAGVEASGAEALENYCLRYGIRGSSFTAPFTLGRIDAEQLTGHRAEEAEREQARIDEAENARALLIGPLEALREGLKARTVGEKLEAVYRYLESIGLPEKLTGTAQRLIEAGDVRGAQEHGAIWKLLMDILDQMYLILGDVPMSRDDFLAVMEEGLSGEVVRTVPDTADRVLVGDIMHTVPGENIRVLFVMGVSEGMLPEDHHDDGLLSNRELDLCWQAGLKLGTGTDRRMAIDRYNIYLALSAATEKLIFSHSMTVDGHESLMSAFLMRIQRDTGVRTELHNGVKGEPASERMGFRLLADKLREEPGDARTQALLAYFRTRPGYAGHAEEMLARSGGLIQPVPVEPGLSKRLFREGQSMSVSRLEQFSGCPFRHFLNYGLRAEIRREAGLKATDLGTFYHAVVERFVREVLDKKLDFAALTDEQTDAMVEEIVPAVVGETGDGMMGKDARLAAQIPLFTENVKATVRSVVRQIKAGSFRPVGAELRFRGNGDQATSFGYNGAFPAVVLDLGDGRAATLEGIIDRVDATPPGPDGKRLYRVIDYKTAGRRMQYENIREGLHMQLPLYLYAVESGDDASEGAGMYYMQVTPKPITESGNPEEDREDLKNQLRLTGITVFTERSIASAGKTPSDMKEALANVSVNKDGTLRSGGSTCTDKQMRLFMRYVKRVAEAKARDMFDGDIAIRPMGAACAYCDHKTVCGFDPKLGCKPCEPEKMDRDAFLTMLVAEAEKEAEKGMKEK